MTFGLLFFPKDQLPDKSSPDFTAFDIVAVGLSDSTVKMIDEQNEDYVSEMPYAVEIIHKDFENLELDSSMFQALMRIAMSNFSDLTSEQKIQH